MPSTEWWRSAAIHQVYVRSFADGNGDGTRDLAGVRARLPYPADLGVGTLRFTPWHLSPMADGGYDVADYRTVEPAVASLREAEDRIAEARELGLRRIVDIVPNHVSDQHEWFQAALAAGARSPERELLHFRPCSTEPPNGVPERSRLPVRPDWAAYAAEGQARDRARCSPCTARRCGCGAPSATRDRCAGSAPTSRTSCPSRAPPSGTAPRGSAWSTSAPRTWRRPRAPNSCRPAASCQRGGGCRGTRRSDCGPEHRRRRRRAHRSRCPRRPIVPP
ncbi:hypothetical protein I8755_03340 [Streptomyces alfalfae]|uniref:Glycosyl hydrolase family 13 catalytic domain-containing protein n=1 Tax=Streptomyces alfalfae TaxID=1642299 RepID=A0A7T4PC56_9ACTN|nr:hypothetical protein I8755_03340 [Streptomyces alfalfae]